MSILSLEKQVAYQLAPPEAPWFGLKGRLAYKQYQVAWPNLPTAFMGKRLLQLSDLHMAVHTREWLMTTLPLIKHLQPDAILLTGDLISKGTEQFSDLKAFLKALPANTLRLACLGNHDVLDGQRGEGVKALLEAEHVHCLVNDVFYWELEGQQFPIVGLHDFSHGMPSPQRVLRKLSEEAFQHALLLCHNPAQFEWPAIDWSRFPLILSGHTHAGQFWSPIWLKRLVAEADYIEGPYDLSDNTTLYVNAGLGTASVHTKKHLPWPDWDIPLPRWGTTPELTLFSLNKA